MPNENDNKLVTLADLAEAYNALYNRDVTTTATQSADGLMSSTDKTKLDSIASGAQVNSITGVKGDTESSYRTGNVNLTAANVGAVAKSGDTMTGQLSLKPAGSEGGQILLGASSDHPEHAGIIIDQYGPSKFRIFGQPSADGTSFTGVGETLTLDPYTKIITGGYTFAGNAANVTGIVQADHGGTGATYGTIDITDYCTFPTGNVDISEPFGGRLYYNPYLNCVFGTIVMNNNASVDNQADIVYLKKDSSGTVLSANRQAACGTCVHSAVSPMAVPRITGNTIKSSHTSVTTITTPRYTIMAFLG